MLWVEMWRLRHGPPDILQIRDVKKLFPTTMDNEPRSSCVAWIYALFKNCSGTVLLPQRCDTRISPQATLHGRSSKLSGPSNRNLPRAKKGRHQRSLKRPSRLPVREVLWD